MLALSKHEQAERVQTRKGASAADAWLTAEEWWSTFLTNHGDSPLAPSARMNYARALEAGGKKPRAIAEYQTLMADKSLEPLERVACLYRASRLR